MLKWLNLSLPSKKFARLAAFTLLVLGILSCTPFSGVLDIASVCLEPVAVGTLSVTVSWNANPDTDVNKSGGGYRIYYASTPNVNTRTCQYVEVPYVSGATAPTTGTIPNLAAGKYYIRVVGISSYNPNGVSGGNQGSDSTEVSVTVQ